MFYKSYQTFNFFLKKNTFKLKTISKIVVKWILKIHSIVFLLEMFVVKTFLEKSPIKYFSKNIISDFLVLQVILQNFKSIS